MSKPDTNPGSAAGGSALIPDLAALGDLPLRVQVELGRSSICVRDLAALEPGTILELHKMTGEPADIVVDDHTIAKGEIVVSEGMLVVRVSMIVGDAMGPA